MKILVTGSDGFLAARFISYYKDKHHITGLNHHQLDITNEHQVFEHFKHHHYDVVFHTAALSDTGFCEQNPQIAQSVNTLGTLLIAKACAHHHIKLIFASSDQVYNGNLEEGPYKENLVLSPQTVYAHSKLNAELAIKGTLEQYYNLRLTWLFSLPEKDKKINPNILMLIKSALDGQSPIKLAANEYRGMTYVYDIVRCYDKLLDLPYGDYNFGSENDLSTYDIGIQILHFMGYRQLDHLIIKDTERFKERKRDLRISNSKLQQYDLYLPSTSIGLAHCLKDFNLFNNK